MKILVSTSLPQSFPLTSAAMPLIVWLAAVDVRATIVLSKKLKNDVAPLVIVTLVPNRFSSVVPEGRTVPLRCL